ncbi:MAG: hypothetical protein JNL34_12785 [Anaerolineae bacterium]|nr:hypothetical protein [Anaerolineae bacterium]
MTPPTTNVNAVAEQLLAAYGIYSPPVPIEAILQRPQPDMWDTIDLSELSGTFFAAGDPYRPRLALTHLLVRLLTGTEWGAQRGLNGLNSSREQVESLARAILMPRAWLARLPATSLTAAAISPIYQVPAAEVVIRLRELDVSAR